MENEIEGKKELSFNSPEIQGLIKDVMAQSEAIKKIDDLGAESFREWLCGIITAIAQRMGYILRDLLVEIPADIVYSFKGGFSEGVEKAKKNSMRYKKRKK